jgi:hypothetical protein
MQEDDRNQSESEHAHGSASNWKAARLDADVRVGDNLIGWPTLTDEI